MQMDGSSLGNIAFIHFLAAHRAYRSHFPEEAATLCFLLCKADAECRLSLYRFNMGNIHPVPLHILFAKTAERIAADRADHSAFRPQSGQCNNGRGSVAAALPAKVLQQCQSVCLWQLVDLECQIHNEILYTDYVKFLFHHAHFTRSECTV